MNYATKVKILSGLGITGLAIIHGHNRKKKFNQFLKTFRVHASFSEN